VFAGGDSLYMRTAKKLMWLEHWHYDIYHPFDIEPGEKIDTADRSTISFRFNTAVNGEIESLNAYGMEAASIELVFKKTPKPKDLTSEELKGYTGEYQLPGAVAKVYLKDEKILTVEVPGQPPYELVPVGNHKFSFKALQGYSIQFEKQEGKPANALTFLQPQGNFKAERKQ